MAQNKLPEEIITRIRDLAGEGMSSAKIGELVGKSRNAVISTCRRHKINLQQKCLPKAKQPPALVIVKEIIPDVPLPPCKWPDGCTTPREAYRKPYCRMHNAIAFREPAVRARGKI